MAAPYVDLWTTPTGKRFEKYQEVWGGIMFAVLYFLL